MKACRRAHFEVWAQIGQGGVLLWHVAEFLGEEADDAVNVALKELLRIGVACGHHLREVYQRHCALFVHLHARSDLKIMRSDKMLFLSGRRGLPC